MGKLKVCSICSTLMSKQNYEDPITKEIVEDYICFNCGYTEPLKEGEDDV